jgi:hypothetical protein
MDPKFCNINDMGAEKRFCVRGMYDAPHAIANDARMKRAFVAQRPSPVKTVRLRYDFLKKVSKFQIKNFKNKLK